MKEPGAYAESGPGMRTFGLNSDYAHWLTLADQGESMLPRVGRKGREGWRGYQKVVVPSVEEG